MALTSHHVQSSPEEIDVICTSNKNQTGECRSSNDEDDPFISLTCTQVSTSIIECSKEDSGQHFSYNCIKSSSISKYQKLFTCQLDLIATKIDVKQDIEDGIIPKVLASEVNLTVEKSDNIDKDKDLAASSYMDALNVNLNNLEFNTNEVETNNSFTYGY